MKYPMAKSFYYMEAFLKEYEFEKEGFPCKKNYNLNRDSNSKEITLEIEINSECRNIHICNRCGFKQPRNQKYCKKRGKNIDIR